MVLAVLDQLDRPAVEATPVVTPAATLAAILVATPAAAAVVLAEPREQALSLHLQVGCRSRTTSREQVRTLAS